MTDTVHYGLRVLDSTQFAADNWKYTHADRTLIDLLLFLGAEGHHHTGALADALAPTSGPGLAVSSSGGLLPGGARARYVYTLLSSSGVESGPSPEAYIDTPPVVAAPAIATNPVVVATTGTLGPGPYFYALSAYQSTTTFETLAPNKLFVAVPLGTSTNKITITLPALPSGATGFNIYRQAPGSIGFRFLAHTTSTTTYVDSGSVAEDPTRPLPAINTTLATNSVTLTPTTVPPGQWRVYRTFAAGVWANSLVATVSGSTYIDTGTVTTIGQPPTSDTVPGSPSKINLETETTSLLPASRVAGLYGAFLELAAAGRPDGYPSLDDDARVSVDALPALALVGLASSYR